MKDTWWVIQDFDLQNIKSCPNKYSLEIKREGETKKEEKKKNLNHQKRQVLFHIYFWAPERTGMLYTGEVMILH